MAHKAYGAAHQRRRKHEIRALKERFARTGVWDLCPRCDETMAPDPLLPHDGLDLGHTNPEDKIAGKPGDRLEHSSCNRSAGNDTRPSTSWSSVEW